ncbi:MAG: ABC transporter ATP-binding protein [Acidiferrobacterales bacterium]
MSFSAAERASPLLRASGLVAGYGPLQVLWDVDLEIGNAECVILLGPNGAGKTTLLKALLGLVALWRGRIEFRGQRLEGQRTDQRVRQGIAYMSEVGVFPNLSIEENLKLGGYYLPRREVQRRAQELYVMFPDLVQRRGVLAGSLSGGQRKMLSLAKAFMSGPRLLVMDEPSAGLSPRYVKEVIATLRQLHGAGLAMLIAEQNLGFLELAGRACILEGGRIRFAGDRTALEQDDILRRSYFGLQETPDAGRD